MSANLIGFQAFVPVAAARRLLKVQLARLEACLSRLGGRSKIVAGGLDPKAAGQAVAYLATAGAKLDDFEGLSPEETLQYLIEDLALVRTFDPAKIAYDDAASDRVQVNGVDVVVLFAGEMTWGDEPEGEGYRLLRALHRTGGLEILYQAVPWNASKLG